MKSLSSFADVDNEVCKTIERKLTEFVNEHDGFIDMRNLSMNCDNVYGIVFDMRIEKYVENRIIAVTTFEKGEQLGVLFSDLECVEEYEDMTKEELLECDDWFTIDGGNIWRNATLINLCESIEQYV